MSSTESATAVQTPIDVPSLVDRCMGDRGLAVQLLKLFLRDAPILLRMAKSATEASDYPAAVKPLHTLKGLSGNISAMPLREKVYAAEMLARGSDRTNLPAAIEGIAALLASVFEDAEALIGPNGLNAGE